jgi:hypothetical protein
LSVNWSTVFDENNVDKNIKNALVQLFLKPFNYCLSIEKNVKFKLQGYRLNLNDSETGFLVTIGHSISNGKNG